MLQNYIKKDEQKEVKIDCDIADVNGHFTFIFIMHTDFKLVFHSFLSLGLKGQSAINKNDNESLSNHKYHPDFIEKNLLETILRFN